MPHRVVEDETFSVVFMNPFSAALLQFCDSQNKYTRDLKFLETRTLHHTSCNTTSVALTFMSEYKRLLQLTYCETPCRLKNNSSIHDSLQVQSKIFKLTI